MARKLVKPGKTRVSDEDLYLVLSISEAAEIWHVSPSTLRYHIDRGTLPARKCGHTVIVPVTGMIALYGNPNGSKRHV